MVKKLLTILFLIQMGLLHAQQVGTTLTFSYDGAGNQIVRELICLGQGCLPKKTTNSIRTSQSVSETTDKEFDWNSLEDNKGVKYYPNPVQDNLYITWEDVKNDEVTQVFVYSATGQLLQNYIIEGQAIQTVVNFSSYPNGMYQVVLFFESQEKQVLRIVKR